MTHESGGRCPFQEVARVGRVFLLVLACAIPPFPALAQERDTTVIVGERYRAGGLHRLLFGRHYRDLWTTPLRVEVLDMRAFGGGLTPTTAGGGLETKSLRFRGSDRREYGFRSIDKEPDVLPPELTGTLVQRLVEDQTSSAYPAGPAVAAALMDAAGILHTNPQMVVLPDDPVLGRFQEQFAGTVGFIEARAITGPGLEPFAGAAEIIDGNEIFERVLHSPRDRVNTREFLDARLFDLFIGDWDRHRGQWGWARFGDEPVTRWIPIPEDRDQAFVRYDGLVLSLGRITNPQLVSFGDDYPGMLGLHWNAREVDRYFLTDLEKQVWDSVATALQARLTNSAIERAAAALPREYRSLDGTRLVRALEARRDKLPMVADEFYRLLAREVDIHATDESEWVTIERHPDGDVEVAVMGASAREPYFRRRFQPGETSEIRLYLHRGDDRVDVRGQGAGDITVRIVGGSGDDEVIDSSRAGGIRFYTSDGDRVSGPTGVKVDRRRYTPPPKASPNEPALRDWGRQWRPVLWAGFGPDAGLFFGAGAYRMQFGFRHDQFASRVRLRVGYATEASTGRLGLLAQFRRSNSRVRFEVDARASGIEVLRFHGFGNEVVLARFDDSEFYRVNQNQFSVELGVVIPLGSTLDLAFGPTFKYTTTDSIAGRFLATLFPLYGTQDFGQVGAHLSLQLDTRDVPAAATRGIWFTVGGSVYPKVWDVDSTTFGEVHGEVATYLTTGPATLALRAGGKKVWGTFPFFEAAFIGDARTVRLGRQNRFAGDAAAYGNAELRLNVAPIFLVLPGRFGIFGIGDIGRVWLEGQSSDWWHPAVGGGIWMSFMTQAYTASIGVTRSEVGTSRPQRTGIYAQAGAPPLRGRQLRSSRKAPAIAPARDRSR